MDKTYSTIVLDIDLDNMFEELRGDLYTLLYDDKNDGNMTYKNVAKMSKTDIFKKFQEIEHVIDLLNSNREF